MRSRTLPYTKAFTLRRAADRPNNPLAEEAAPSAAPARILVALVTYDVMIGSRYVSGGGSANWPLSRRLMSRGINALVPFVLRIPARDCSGAYRCYRVSKLRQAHLERVRSHGYSLRSGREGRSRHGTPGLLQADLRLRLQLHGPD